jgi:hypothetical protein
MLPEGQSPKDLHLLKDYQGFRQRFQRHKNQAGRYSTGLPLIPPNAVPAL